MAKQLKFTKFTPQSFAGIREDMKLVVLFPEDSNITEIKGDQGVGKTSVLNALKRLLGGEMPSNAVNSKDGKVAAKLEFELEDGRKVEVSCNKSNVTLYVTQDGTRSLVSSPVSFLQKEIGSIGVSPMFLKDKKGPDQVKWLREIASLPEKELKLEMEINTNATASFKKRTAVNKEVKQLKADLDRSPFFVFDDENKLYNPTAEYNTVLQAVANGASDAKAVQEEFQKASQNHVNFRSWTDALEEVRQSRNTKQESIDRKKEEIARLQAELVDQEADLAKVDTRIADGQKKIAELGNTEVVYEEAMAKMNNLTEISRKKDAAESDMWKSNQYNAKVEESLALTAKLAEYDVASRRLIQLITPDVEGIEVKVKRTIDLAEEEENYRLGNPKASDATVKGFLDSLGSGNEEGLFYKGRNVDQLCESELWDLCLILWKYMGVNVIFIENLNTLGSDAVERINWFAEQGKVFYSEMERGTKDIQISFTNKIKSSGVKVPKEEVPVQGE